MFLNDFESWSIANWHDGGLFISSGAKSVRRSILRRAAQKAALAVSAIGLGMSMSATAAVVPSMRSGIFLAFGEHQIRDESNLVTPGSSQYIQELVALIEKLPRLPDDDSTPASDPFV